MHKNDFIGRRVYTSDISIDGESVKIRWKAFFDKRLEEDLSVDHLGNNAVFGINRGHCRHLAEGENGIEVMTFEGWGGLKVSRLEDRHHAVIARPTMPPDEDNPYHCEISRQNHRDRPAAESLAFELVLLCSDTLGFIPKA